MLTIALLDNDIMMRLGLTIILEKSFKSIKILEADDLARFQKMHDGIASDLFIVGNYHSGKKRSVKSVQEIKDQFPLSRLIVYDYISQKHINESYISIGVKGHLLRKNIGSYLVSCVKSVINDQYFMCPDVSDSVLSSRFPLTGQLNLTARESLIAELLVNGKTINWIANVFERSPDAIKSVKGTILKKTQVSSVPELKKLILNFSS